MRSQEKRTLIEKLCAVYCSECFIFQDWAPDIYLCRCGWIDRQSMTNNPFLVEYIIKILLWYGAAAATCLLVAFGPMPLLRKSHPVSICGIADQSVGCCGFLAVNNFATCFRHCYSVLLWSVAPAPSPCGCPTSLHQAAAAWVFHRHPFPTPIPPRGVVLWQRSFNASRLATCQYCVVGDPAS